MKEGEVRCECGREEENVEHVMYECEEESTRRAREIGMNKWRDARFEPPIAHNERKRKKQ